MGLDMYLNAERYLWSHEDGDKQISENIGQLVGLPTDGKVKTITVEAGYWRKSNQIHNWFVANVQEGKDECQEAYVSREQLTELREVGFFFGGTEYDQWYFNDIEETIKIIDNALLMPKQWDFNYRSSW